MGVFASGGRQSTWVKNDLNTDGLLALIENRTAEKVLACVGSNDRLNMLLAILRKPRTVAELVNDCGYSSTGQVYHHLKPLLTADLVTEDKAHRGTYIIQPHRVQGVIMLLAGSILTVITIARMCSGKINIPLWAKILLSIAMIAMLLITLLGMLPTRTITVTTDQITQIIIPNQD